MKELYPAPMLGSKHYCFLGFAVVSTLVKESYVNLLLDSVQFLECEVCYWKYVINAELVYPPIKDVGSFPGERAAADDSCVAFCDLQSFLTLLLLVGNAL